MSGHCWDGCGQGKLNSQLRCARRAVRAAPGSPPSARDKARRWACLLRTPFLPAGPQLQPSDRRCHCELEDAGGLTLEPVLEPRDR